MTLDHVVTVLEHLAVPVTLAVAFGFAGHWISKGQGSELVRALLNYLKAATQHLATMPGLVQREAARSREEMQRAHLETRALLTVLLRGPQVPGERPELSPGDAETPTPTPTEPAVRRSKGGPPTSGG